MRTLCLNLQNNSAQALAEKFLVFSPQVHFRAPNLVFLDISKTAQHFGGEGDLLQEALSFSKDFFPKSRAAIANSPATAQVFSTQYSSYICDPQREHDDIAPLPLESLTQLEGLIAWNSVDEVNEIVHYFQTLGLKKIGQIQNFRREAFRTNWGKTGLLLWERLHGFEKQIIQTLQPTETLSDHVYLDFPVSLKPFLLHCLDKSLLRLLNRLKLRQQTVKKILIHLYCEYADNYHLLELKNEDKNSNQPYLFQQLEQKIFQLDLDNPIKEFEIELITHRQPLNSYSHIGKLKQQQLSSAHSCSSGDSSILSGFLKNQIHVKPFQVLDQFPEIENDDFVGENILVGNKRLQIQSSYAQASTSAPRPSRVLIQPKRLSPVELKQMQLISSKPIERTEDAWWEISRGREYFFALSPQGNFLWLYHDLIDDEFYLHGYCD